MNQGVYPLAASMVNQINRLDQISNNLANVNTSGFKEEGLTETTFNYYLQRMQEKNENPTIDNIVTNNIPKIDSRFIDGKAGGISLTGNKLDFALKQSDTFFKFQNENGDIVYTRDGAFKNLDGFLVDSNGNNILSNDNAPIELNGENFVSQIGVAQISFNNLEKIGSNSYKLKDDAAVINLESNDDIIIQGSIERSNVNPVSSMVALIDAHRRFEQSQKAISSIDELNSKVIDKIGNNTR